MICFRNCGREVGSNGYPVTVRVINTAVIKKFVLEGEVRICTQCFLKEMLLGNIIRQGDKYIFNIIQTDKPQSENGGS